MVFLYGLHTISPLNMFFFLSVLILIDKGIILNLWERHRLMTLFEQKTGNCG